MFIKWLADLLFRPFKILRQCYFCGHRWDELHANEYTQRYAPNPIRCKACGLPTAWKM